VADAAAYVPTHRLDLSAVQPDFVPISFYKLFGELLHAYAQRANMPWVQGKHPAFAAGLRPGLQRSLQNAVVCGLVLQPSLWNAVAIPLFDRSAASMQLHLQSFICVCTSTSAPPLCTTAAMAVLPFAGS
jgi:hypothetical protein